MFGGITIDKSFIGLDGVPGDLVERSHKIRSRILQWVGVPCCVGIGTTKTLAKLANHVAKTAERKPGLYPAHLAQVCNLATLNPAERQAVFEATEVGEVWGIGRRIGKQLVDSGIQTEQDLVRMDVATARHGWSVVLERTVRELQGTPCIGLDDAPAPKQEIACTRSFGHAVTALSALTEAVSEFSSRAAEKLRKQSMCVFGASPSAAASNMTTLRKKMSWVKTTTCLYCASAAMRRATRSRLA